MPLIDIAYDSGRAGLAPVRRTATGPRRRGCGLSRGAAPRPTKPGDVEIRFRQRSPLDVGGLDVVIEVRTKLFANRVQDKQRRSDLLLDGLAGLNLGRLGVWLVLAEGAWSQSSA